MSPEAPLRAWRDRDGRLARLRLSRPKANIVDAAMIAALDAALAEAAGEARIRGVLLDAEGPHLSFAASVEVEARKMLVNYIESHQSTACRVERFFSFIAHFAQYKVLDTVEYVVRRTPGWLARNYAGANQCQTAPPIQAE